MDETAYFHYLRGRSRLSLAYRRLFLYPRLSRHLSGRTLDVGCGIGDMLAFRPDTVGVDVNEQAVAWCRAQGLDARRSTADRLPFGPAEFDSAVLDNVLEHLPDPRPVLGEIHRILAPGGTLLVGVPGEKGFAADPDHKVYYDERKLRATLENSSFHSVHMLHAPFGVPWLSRLLAQYCLYGVFRKK